jgi:hypothetical protein
LILTHTHYGGKKRRKDIFSIISGHWEITRRPLRVCRPLSARGGRAERGGILLAAPRHGIHLPALQSDEILKLGVQ